MRIVVYARYINTAFKYIIDKCGPSPASRLTGALRGLQHVFRELTDDITSRMVTRDYHATTVPFGHRYTHLGGVLPDDLREVTRI